MFYFKKISCTEDEDILRVLANKEVLENGAELDVALQR